MIPVGQDRAVRDRRINLIDARPDPRGAAEALEETGVPVDRAYQLASLARRSMPSLIRRLARDPRISRPKWSEPPAVSILAPLVLVGRWTSSIEDRDIVSCLVRQDWNEIERTLLHWLNSQDPPFVRSGQLWHLASAEEAFLLMLQSVSPSDLRRWHEVAFDVLVETDPVLELLPTDRPMAAIRGIRLRHSSDNRRGLAEGVALVGSLEDDDFNYGTIGADHARRLVRRILRVADMDRSGKTWQSLADVLPLLAEAAPSEFVDAVNDDLDQAEPLLSRMFQDRDQTSSLHSSSPHTGLLWALETVCWSADYLLDAARALARLHTIDPGGKLSNRPIESLRNVLVGWVRHTGASVPLKTNVITQICRQLPDVGWRLVLDLWPEHHSFSSPPASPRYRDWLPQSRDVAIPEWIDYIKHLVDLSIRLANDHPGRWADLIEHLGSLPAEERRRLLDALDEFIEKPNLLGAQERLALWESLRRRWRNINAFPGQIGQWTKALCFE